jgi:hypothetical protein
MPSRAAFRFSVFAWLMEYSSERRAPVFSFGSGHCYEFRRIVTRTPWVAIRLTSVAVAVQADGRPKSHLFDAASPL